MQHERELKIKGYRENAINRKRIHDKKEETAGGGSGGNGKALAGNLKEMIVHQFRY